MKYEEYNEEFERDKALAAYYDDEMWERPLPERIPKPLISITVAGERVKARLNRSAHADARRM